MNDDLDENLTAEHTPEVIKARLNRPAVQNVVSDAILGGIDGCVTTFAVVSGVVGAGLSPSIALVLGFANLMADGFSMAISNYESIKADREFIQSIREKEQKHIEKIPSGEREEIRQIFERKGFSEESLDQIVNTICSDSHLWIDTMLTEEYGISRASREPVKSAVITFFSFFIIGSIPLVPFMISGIAKSTQFTVSAFLAAVMFFSIGAMKSRVFSQPVLHSGLSTLLTGSIAASLAFLVGYLLKGVFGIDAL